ncbi:hypothetical protein [Sedimenticola selenatireducens]|uniref:Uncharacterized protein n=1 Tax=Sedimenticola selenatireducens TaxID=191960 RepID=A0A557SMB7_9GAMM|nr:hypothetical protein [Sedimenticola selenatireducens]TVO78452.1 hypothetical protein FHP88_01950 [Sedimenticola selenatireducens]TVT62689.1 MAG: hypothetical protein FHK78_13505 [Sedimenticola selenatireducens]
MKQMKPVLPAFAPNPNAQHPIPSKTNTPKKWTFSFRFWKQIEYFGLDKTDSAWMVSVLEKLQVLSQENIESVLCSPEKKKYWRYHNIDWGQKNIPVQRADLDWITDTYRDNPEDYPFVQFQISKSLGRVIGFWDDKDTFNIVLLDPYHNMQPSKAYSYNVDPCGPLSCDYTTLLAAIDSLAESDCERKSCEIRYSYLDINSRSKQLESFGVYIVKMSDENRDLYADLKEKGHVKNIHDVLMVGIDGLIEGL